MTVSSISSAISAYAPQASSNNTTAIPNAGVGAQLIAAVAGSTTNSLNSGVLQSYLSVEGATSATSAGMATQASAGAGLLNSLLNSTNSTTVSSTLASAAAVSTASNLNNSWAQVLQSNPALAGLATIDQMNQNIVNTLA